MADYGREHVQLFMGLLATYLGATLPIYKSIYIYTPVYSLLGHSEDQKHIQSLPRDIRMAHDCL
jgi:hypothetical protein